LACPQFSDHPTQKAKRTRKHCALRVYISDGSSGAVHRSNAASVDFGRIPSKTPVIPHIPHFSRKRLSECRISSFPVFPPVPIQALSQFYFTALRNLFSLKAFHRIADKVKILSKLVSQSRSILALRPQPSARPTLPPLTSLRSSRSDPQRSENTRKNTRRNTLECPRNTQNTEKNTFIFLRSENVNSLSPAQSPGRRRATPELPDHSWTQVLPINEPAKTTFLSELSDTTR
jgi:hypothetical protein